MAEPVNEPVQSNSAGKSTSPINIAQIEPAMPTGALYTAPKGTAQKQRRFNLLASFLLVFMLPSVLGAWYYAAVATDRYAAGASFVVRGLEAGGSPDIFSSFTGLTSSGSTTSDSYIIRRYLESAELVRMLDEKFDLRSYYGDQSIDILSRFNTETSFEDFVEYWQRRIITTFDSTTGIVSFEVQSFDPQKTLLLANFILSTTDQLVNTLSKKARQDSVQFATSEMLRSEERLRAAQLDLLKFRSTQGSVDPTMNAQLDAQLIASLEAQFADTQARIDALSGEVDADAPMMRQLRRQATALETQIAQRRAAIGDRSPSQEGTSTADALAAYEALQLEQTFAQQRYASALSSLENARMDADRQQRYLAIFARPFLPDEAIYPYRLRNALLTIAAAFALWAIGTLITYAVRDHMR